MSLNEAKNAILYVVKSHIMYHLGTMATFSVHLGVGMSGKSVRQTCSAAISMFGDIMTS